MKEKKDITSISDVDRKNYLINLSNLKSEYSLMKLKHAVSPLANPSVLKNKRREIARYLTKLSK